MKHVFKLILAIVVLAFSFNSSFADTTINLSINNGKLIIKPQIVTVNVGDNVTWKFDSAIKSFWFASNSGTNPFTVTIPGPASPEKSSFTATARNPTGSYGWVYNMAAQNSKGEVVMSDPKIIVKPKTTANTLLILVGSLAAILGGLNIFLGFTVIKLRRRVKSLISSNNNS